MPYSTKFELFSLLLHYINIENTAIMNRPWNVLILSLLTTTFLNAQALSKKEWKSALKAHYKQYQQLTKAKKYVYQEVLFEREEFFEEVPASAEIAKTRALVAKTANIKIIEVDNEPQLAFEAQITDGYPDFIGDQIDIAFVEADLKTTKGKALQLQDMYQSGADGNTLLHRVGIAGDRPPAANNVSGKAIYDLSFLLRYDQVKLSKENLGESFNLAGCDYILIEVLHNQVILEKSCNQYEDPQLINWGKEGHYYSPYPYDQLMEMAAKDPTIDQNGSFTQSSSSVSKNMYQLLKKQPDLSSKQLRKAFPKNSYLQQVVDGEQYLVVSSIAPIKGNFTLFAPVYETDRVEVEY